MHSALQVVRQGGLSYLMGLEPGSPMDYSWQESDRSAVKDASEALLAIAASSEEGRRVCLQSGAIAAVSSHLQVLGIACA